MMPEAHAPSVIRAVNEEMYKDEFHQESYGSPSLLCTPTRWTDVAIFFLANYVAHAATIKSLPGEPTLATLLVHIAALMFPLSGILRGVRAIRQFAILSDTPLRTAAKAEALCVVIRTSEWLPQRGDIVCVSKIQFPSQTRPSAQFRTDREETQKRPSFWIEENYRSFLPSNSSSKIQGRKVHGICRLPHGYALAILPPGARVMEICKDQREGLEVAYISSSSQRLKDALKMLRHIRSPYLTSESDDSSSPDTRPEIELSSNYNLPKCVVAIFQTLYASATLYETKGDQIQRYGYAAFGLTVAPYLVMSIINLFGTMLTPDYPCVYLVRSEIMDEASRREGAKFEGMVATLRSGPRKVWHYVEFTIDENDRMFIRSPRESKSQRGLHDATDVVQRKIIPQRALYLTREPCLVISSPGFSDDLPLHTTLDNITLFAGLIIGLSPIAINGSLSHFNAGHSTIAQRVWTMNWLAFGWWTGLLVDLQVGSSDDILFLTLLFTAPAIGGFVVVAQTLMSYGLCVAIDEANF
ncbi:hypothetical protein JMJ35_008698 [Cladonia borealis]|uniref:Uncharacterized protein n=1 Tax=Cladonia borealis TaxID=184061 RepID=A0AA39QU83_9LECA|nr:hypothetical protein JMJ35_008698 [Cladonia borealis]